MKNNKGQSSFEYTGTYIWAGIAIVAVVGTLAYMGAFDSENYSTEGCESGSQVVCQDAQAIDSGVFNIMVQNNLNKQITINHFEVTNREDFYPSYGTDILAPSDQAILESEGSALGAGKKEYFEYSFTYVVEGGTREHTVRGSATVEVTDTEHTSLNATETEDTCGNGHKDAREECDSSGQGTYCMMGYFCNSNCSCQFIDVVDDLDMDIGADDKKSQNLA